MLRFFRKIRQNLLENGNVRTYFWYALGEVFLVVIGILIALQINNWNIERIERKEETAALNNLKSDYLEAIDELKYLNGLRTKMLSATDELLTKRSLLITDPHRIDSLLSELNTNPTFNNQSGSLDVLINSGGIDLIQDDSLKRMLLKWPGTVEDMVEGELDQKHLNENFYKPLIRTYVSESRIINVIKNRGIESRISQQNTSLPFLIRETDFEPDYEGLFNNLQLENILNSREGFLFASHTETNVLIETAEEIIERINQIIED
ncbi:MAG: DUF6090 family protein [Balneolaceae bacterium]